LLPSQYFIHDNKFFASGEFAEGLFFFDSTSPHFIDAAAWNNTVELQNTLSEGIGVINTKGTQVLNNSVTGYIGLYGNTLDVLINNDVSGVTIDGTVGNAQIFLDPGTSHDFVLCSTRSDTVVNQGTDNNIIRCQQAAVTSGAAAANVDARVAPRMPRVRKGSL
jgi:hypothetical protein